jgi:hypothetical protein
MALAGRSASAASGRHLLSVLISMVLMSQPS